MNDPLLGYLIEQFKKENTPIDALIMDSVPMNQKDHQIFQERTAGRLPYMPIENLESYMVPTYFVKDHRSSQTAALVKHLNLDLLVNAGTLRILKNDILTAPRIGVVNCHPGMLPKFRGCTCVEWAIYLDEQVGNTIHFMTEGIDDGPIVLKEGLTFSKKDTYVDIRVAVYKHGLNLLARGVNKIINEHITPQSLPKALEGPYFKVIGQSEMNAALDKLRNGQYAFQK
jgi:methionyl-tRNA formyltransferase